MRIGLLCPEVPGHLNPMTTLGNEIRRRGHEVVLLGSRMADTIAKRADIPLIELGRDDPLSDAQEESFRKLGRTSGFQSMMQTGKSFGIAVKLIQRHLPAALREENLDGMVIDQFAPAGCLIAEREEIPYAVACNALAMYWDPLLPPPPLPWGYRADMWGRARNRIAKTLLPPIYNWLSDRRNTGVDPMMLVLEPDHGLVHIAQQPAFFDFPREKPVDRLHFTGPWHQAARDDGSCEFPWDWLDGRPLLYASMGTLQNSLAHVFQMIVDAVRDRPVQVVLTKGGSDVEISTAIPQNVLLVDRAPQLRLLERASLAITHAGLNTALECLAHGVPMLCLPVTNDQPGVAKRVEWIGAGRVIPVGKVSLSRLSAELDRMLQDDSFLVRAKAWQQEIQIGPGVEQAAELVERAISTRQTILQASAE